MKRLLIFAALLFPASLPAEAPPRLQSKIKGLLVVELAGGKEAGSASQMNATAVRTSSGTPMIGYNQEVGEAMTAAAQEVQKFIHVRHHGSVPEGYRFELAFADKYSLKDGPSAAVASALLVDSILSDNELAGDFAVTGDMNADGAVQPVGGVLAKIRGARLKGCPIVAIPRQNESAIADGYLIDGLQEIRSTQIFAIATFDEAHAIASSRRSGELSRALEEFSKVQEVLDRDQRLVSNPKVLEKLREVSSLAPNHLSAKYLLLHGMRRAPRNLSLPGSLTAIDEAGRTLGQMVESGSFTQTSGNSDVLFKFEGEMARLKPLLDTRTRAYCEAYIHLAEFIKDNRSKRVFTQQMEREFRGAISRIEAARGAILSDSELMEELMLQE